MTFKEAAIFILEKNNNKPMSAEEICNQALEENLFTTKGLTPSATMNTVLLRCVNAGLSFEIAERRHMRYRLKSYMRKDVKNFWKDNGFVTEDQLSDLRNEIKDLKSILEKNNIKI